MEKIHDVTEAERKTFEDIKEFIRTISMFTEEVKNIDEGIKSLRAIRRLTYENMNQIQHEHLVLKGMQWLRVNGYADSKYEWYWNPRQTGDANEPDLMAKDGVKTILCGEATTSENPVGLIDSRMRDTLDELNKMEGKKYYFVRTKQMELRANTKIRNNNLDITVTCINSDA